MSLLITFGGLSRYTDVFLCAVLQSNLKTKAFCPRSLESRWINHTSSNSENYSETYLTFFDVFLIKVFLQAVNQFHIQLTRKKMYNVVKYKSNQL